MTTGPVHRHRLMTVLLGVSLLAGMMAGDVSAHGPGHDEWKATVTPTSAAAGTVATTKLSFTLLVDTHHPRAVIGSFGITPPAGFTVKDGTAKRAKRSLPVTVVGGVVQIANTNLRRAGQTVRVSLRSAVSCGTRGLAGWSVVAHAAATLSVPSRDARMDAVHSTLRTPVDACSLAFRRQPALAGVGRTVTSVPADPGGAAVGVQLLDGTGSPASQSGVSISISITGGTGSPAATLGGVTSDATGAAGMAVFAPTIDKVANGYRLDATAGAGIAGATSDPFDVPGVAVACSGDCAASDRKGATTASVSAATSGGTLTLSLGLEDVDCHDAVNHYYRSSSEPIVFDVSAGTGRTVVVIGLAAASVDRWVFRYQVCFSSPSTSFTNRYGKTIAAGDAGLLPGCWWYLRDDADRVSTGRQAALAADAPPCLEARWTDRDGDVFVRFSVPPGDPRGKI